MEVSGLHFRAVLPPGKNPDTKWTEDWMGPEPVWTFKEREKCLAPAGIRAPDLPGRSLGVNAHYAIPAATYIVELYRSIICIGFHGGYDRLNIWIRYSPVGWRFRLQPCPAAECRMLRQRTEAPGDSEPTLCSNCNAAYRCPQWPQLCTTTPFIYETFPLTSATPRGAPPAVTEWRGDNASRGLDHQSAKLA
jgi:hypothetical protein